MDHRVVWGPRGKDLTGEVRKNLLRKVFLELIKTGVESWLYCFCDTGVNSLNLSYLASMPLTVLP